MKIPKSFLLANPQFDLQVAEHAEKLRQWREREAIVAAEKGNDRIPPIERHQPYDRPRAPDLIEAAIDENFQPSYEIEDDSEAALAQMKMQLLGRVAELERAAIAAIVPPGKVRLLHIREGKIAAEDAERVKLLMERRSKPGFLKKLIGGKEEEFDLKSAVEEHRPAADTKHLQEQRERRERIAAIQEVAAQAMHDIEDLTAETIGAWQDPDFSGV